jgi:threonine/homoserine/homoserine lactone efflux protein
MTFHLTFLISGLVFGLSGGLSPGPLLTLVISETLKHGAKEGIKVAMAPLLTDLPIVIVALYILSRLANLQLVLGAISLFGAAFLVFLAYGSISFKGVDSDRVHLKPQSFKKGVVVNFLNPSPYLFWFSIGAPLVFKASKVSILAAFLFILCFYTFLVGSKVLLAMVVGNSRRFLKSKHYVYTVRFLGVILLVFAFYFFKDGLSFLGII